ncbi:hypothetical protein OG772_36020 [Streptomyces sp. NBC_01321]|uniref:hypothetical protein n=1 Tax=Streptomyces sp. NBC_01321 TaxID=2903825 RepID=UPI002E0F814B|nr:hypothetical protein OG772_36020 [Streptomyces sp. NBC_01321]
MFSSLQRQFQHDNLPIDGDITRMTGDPTEQAEKIFVRQLGLIGPANGPPGRGNRRSRAK